MTFRSHHCPTAATVPGARSISRRLATAFLLAVTGCKATEAPGAPAVPISGVGLDAQRAIADTITRAIENAYDLTKPDAVQRLMALYPDSGPVISAADGRITTSRDSIQAAVESFWDAMG